MSLKEKTKSKSEEVSTVASAEAMADKTANPAFAPAGATAGEARQANDMVSVRDLISPAGMQVSANFLQVSSKYVRTLFVLTYPRYLQTGWFSPIINLDISLDVAMFIHPVDSIIILKNLKRTVTRLSAQLSSNQEKGLTRDPMLETAIQDAESLRDELQQGNEKFFKFGLYITIYADSAEELEKSSTRVATMLEGGLIYTKPTLFQMKEGFFSTLPLCQDKISVLSNMNTSPLSTSFPFTSCDLSSNEGILYGINRHNNSLILFDRFKMENANMVIFAKSGAGKSYMVKLEILRSLMMGTDVLVIDPENEYKHLCDTVGGAYVKISLASENHLNPFDLPPSIEDEDFADTLRSNIVNLIGLVRLMLGDLAPEEEAIIDEGIRETYAIKDITANSNFSSEMDFPTMQDFQMILSNMKGAESLSQRIKKYTEGVFAGFLNNKTNTDVNKQLVVFSMRDMEEELRPIAMYIVLNFIWTIIRSKLKKRELVVDEAWVMMKNENAASFLFGIAKRCRKYFLGLTTISQDVNDFLSSNYGKPIVTNSSMQLLLRQSPASMDVLTETFNLTKEERFLLLESGVGEGIFFAGLKHVAISVVASYSEDQIITSDPSQLLEIEKAKAELASENNQEG
ncbi:DUF87 domain-containing protein [bacterium]|nr:MAG: DUF87 domain-containing protein [bacterium]